MVCVPVSHGVGDHKIRHRVGSQEHLQQWIKKALREAGYIQKNRRLRRPREVPCGAYYVVVRLEQGVLLELNIVAEGAHETPSEVPAVVDLLLVRVSRRFSDLEEPSKAANPSLCQ